MDKRVKIIIAILILVTVIVILYPKECGSRNSDYNQEYLPNELYIEDCSCLGYEYTTNSDALGLAGCGGSCPDNEYCMGIPTGKECYNLTMGGPGKMSTMVKTECR